MQSGRVVWFDPGKAFGFIAPDSGGKDVFVHGEAARRSGIELRARDHVEFAIVDDKKGRPSAVDLRLLEEATTHTGGRD